MEKQQTCAGKQGIQYKESLTVHDANSPVANKAFQGISSFQSA